MIVVDTNIIGYLYLTSEHSSQVEQVFTKDPHWVAPLLWRSEFRNVLAFYMRRQILSLEEVLLIMDEAIELMQENEYEISSLQVLKLATSSNCSAYDCEFVALAQELDVPLITVDKQILQQFPLNAYSLEAYIAYP
jgi:predicted nucleic acid-binding protein